MRWSEGREIRESTTEQHQPKQIGKSQILNKEKKYNEKKRLRVT